MSDRAVSEALAHVDQSIVRMMDDACIPGLALAVTDRARLLATRNYGFADLAAQAPVTGETLFELGSIGKSFTAICLLQLAEEGVVDFDAPVTAYLPWFSVRSSHAPITIHHLLTHSAGLIGGSDFPLDPRFEVWALRDTDAAPPGARCHYSNVGYKALGLILEAVTGRSYAQLIQARIFAPLGMTRCAAAITHDLRRRLAVGYVPFYDDRPWRSAHGLVPATWLESNTADGCLSSTASDLAIYLRMLLNGGVGPRGALISPESFQRMRAPHVEIRSGVPYGYGLVNVEKDGRPLLGHDGGMVGYVSSMLGDVAAGIGVVVLTNGSQSTEEIASYVLRAIVSARSGAPLPDLPAALGIDPGGYAGVFRSNGTSLSVTADNSGLMLDTGNERIPLAPMRHPPLADAFLADHPAFDRVPFRFGRDSAGRVVELAHGGDWYAGDDHDGPTEFQTPPEWAAFPGHYRSYNPWSSNFRVVLRKGALLLAYPGGHEEPLTPLPDAGGASFRIGDDESSPERIAFDTIVAGVALRARIAGGADYYRFFTI